MSRKHIIPAESRQSIADMFLRSYALSGMRMEDIARRAKIRPYRLSKLLHNLEKIKASPESASLVMPRLEVLTSLAFGMGYNMSVIMRKQK